MMKNGISLVVKIACEDSQLANFDLQMCAKKVAKKWQTSYYTHTHRVSSTRYLHNLYQVYKNLPM